MNIDISEVEINSLIRYQPVLDLSIKAANPDMNTGRTHLDLVKNIEPLTEILFIASYPPRECGIATYSYDLIDAIRKKFGVSFNLRICALEEKKSEHEYPNEVKYILHSSEIEQYNNLARQVNNDPNLKLIFIQHEFGLFGGNFGDYLLRFLFTVKKPIITSFHTVLPSPGVQRLKLVQSMADYSAGIVVMTNHAAGILEKEYGISPEKITVIPHGTHLVSPFISKEIKAKYRFGNRKILTTFGLLNSGKNIETALDALPSILRQFPNVLYLIIGRTHPGVVKLEGEKYRDLLYQKVINLQLQDNVRFINRYLSLTELLEYLQRTDIYFFTSNDPFQAVSGTFAYAMASGCPIISTPIPHARELLNCGEGIIVDFHNPTQLAEAALKLLSDPALMQKMKMNGIHKISPTAWQNSSLAHIELFQKITGHKTALKYELPEISMEHIRRLTTHTGIIQFSVIPIPDLGSGYTLDDNARAMIAVIKHYKLTGQKADLWLIDTYLNFIVFCQQAEGDFLNYVDFEGKFPCKNNEENLDDSNGRAIWALGEIIANKGLFMNHFAEKATIVLEKALKHIGKLQSPRAIAFSIKGLYKYEQVKKDARLKNLIISLADNLVSKYRGVSEENWHWYEEYLTYANSVLPESLLYAYLSTGNELFKTIARSSFDFLLSILFREEKIKVVSNQGWHIKGIPPGEYGEQPVDVSYTILALDLFYETFKEPSYLEKIETAFNWFLGKNHLHQIVYNPCTGGCYDGLEKDHINLNQGAESTVSYLMSRLTMEKYKPFQPQKKTTDAPLVKHAVLA